MKSYSVAILPYVGERYWPQKDMTLDPMDINVGSRKPRKNRRRNPYEDPQKMSKLTKLGRVLSCKTCAQAGNNKRSYPVSYTHLTLPTKRIV